ncbi:type IV pili twitching motility protein PilT [bacterium]|nr:type IV pili twitching motility protein PilT [bacterium]|tara:strand:+ start:51434 stop:52489 length:1056 start_codon:yes stop_codon:yes gene_type:complete
MDKAKLDELIDIVIKEGASDLHLSAGRKPTIRVAGDLISLVKQSELSKEETLAFLSSLVGEERKKEFLETHEIDFSYSTQEGMRFRGNAFVQRGAVGVALRLIPAKIKTLEELNLPPILETFAQRKQGFFLAVGPVGHGKSTTLAAMIDIVNRERTEHIVTIEDPIEFVFEEGNSIIDQREVGSDTQEFHSALRSVFRQDVDVIMVGEMRGPETIATAVTAAETGHLVLSTLHTNNASQTIDRIIDSFPPEQQGQIRAQLSQSLAGVFSQRLIPRVSGGVIPAYELLINNNAVANLIREGRTHEINVVIETGTAEGMVNMDRTLAELVRRGEITPENAQAYSLNAETLKNN